MIPLTKTMAPEDLLLLGPQLRVVDANFSRESEQHPARRWECAMAMKAVQEFEYQRGPVGKQLSAFDIGGAGSPLLHMLGALDVLVEVIDPKYNMALSEVASLVRRHVVTPSEIVTCISTIEHVPDEAGFINDLAEVVAPGGLLFMTTDIWGKPAGVPDTAHFSHMRERIYCPSTWAALGARFAFLGFKYFGATDPEYHGDQLYGSYSFASMALRKEV